MIVITFMDNVGIGKEKGLLDQSSKNTYKMHNSVYTQLGGGEGRGG